jgi:Ethanolamine utilization protein EutJ (predicted chaperonin)
MIDADGVDRFSLTNSTLYAEDNVAGAAEAVRLDTDTKTVIQNNHIFGEFSDGCIVGEGAAGSSILIDNNILYNADTTGGETIDLNVAHTGTISRNIMGTLFTTAPETAFDPGSCLCNQNYMVNAINETGIVVPPTQST